MPSTRTNFFRCSKNNNVQLHGSDQLDNWIHILYSVEDMLLKNTSMHAGFFSVLGINAGVKKYKRLITIVWPPLVFFVNIACLRYIAERIADAGHLCGFFVEAS